MLTKRIIPCLQLFCLFSIVEHTVAMPISLYLLFMVNTWTDIGFILFWIACNNSTRTVSLPVFQSVLCQTFDDTFKYLFIGIQEVSLLIGVSLHRISYILLQLI